MSDRANPVSNFDGCIKLSSVQILAGVTVDIFFSKKENIYYTVIFKKDLPAVIFKTKSETGANNLLQMANMLCIFLFSEDYLKPEHSPFYGTKLNRFVAGLTKWFAETFSSDDSDKIKSFPDSVNFGDNFEEFFEKAPEDLKNIFLEKEGASIVAYEFSEKCEHLAVIFKSPVTNLYSIGIWNLLKSADKLNSIVYLNEYGTREEALDDMLVLNFYR